MQQRDKPLQDWIRPLAGRTSHPPIPATGFLDVDNRSGIMVSQVFQYSQALHAENKFTFFIVPITDRSVWKLSKEGPLQTYRAKYFYLPVPSTKEVLDKRLNYLQRKAAEEKDSRQYFVGKGKRFAFAEVETLSDDIYIPARTLADAGIETIFAGTKVQMVIEPGRFGRYTCALIEVLDEPDVDALSIQ